MYQKLFCKYNHRGGVFPNFFLHFFAKISILEVVGAPKVITAQHFWGYGGYRGYRGAPVGRFMGCAENNSAFRLSIF